MRMFPSDSQANGDVVTPFALNNELREMFSCIHSHDWYNFIASSLPATKLEDGAAGDVRVVGYDGSASAKTVDTAANSNDVYPMVDAADVDWVEEFTSADSVLLIVLSCTLFDSNPTTFLPVWIGVRVDGVLAARSGTEHSQNGLIEATLMCSCMIPVGAGVHLIEPVWGVNTNLAAWTSKDIELEGRLLSIRELNR